MAEGLARAGAHLDPLKGPRLGCRYRGMTRKQVPPSAAVLELPPVTAPVREVDELLEALEAGRAGETCNFYAGADIATHQRRERLRQYLTARWAAPVVLVGEAAGYRGARLSGVPFTSQHQVLGHGMREATATIVHGVLAELGAEAQVLLWNAVPYHPHRRDEPESNRSPTAAEVTACGEMLRAVVAGRTPVAVGQVAARALLKLCTAVVVVRHPAFGGKTCFAAGLAAVLRGELSPGTAGGR
jgi:uracil-DNA glycosylase